MREFKRDRHASIVIAGHAFVQTCGEGITSWLLRNRNRLVAVAFDELALVI
jgi:hypothetical protein